MLLDAVHIVGEARGKFGTTGPANALDKPRVTPGDLKVNDRIHALRFPSAGRVLRLEIEDFIATAAAFFQPLKQPQFGRRACGELFQTSRTEAGFLCPGKQNLDREFIVLSRARNQTDKLHGEPNK